MAIGNAVRFIRSALTNEGVTKNLEQITASDKKVAILEIVRIGKESGFEFTESEYEEAAGGLYILHDVKNKGIEELKTIPAGLASNCSCSGCAACSACLACLACISCAWCIVIPFGGEAVIAADAAGVVSAASAAATGVSTGVATAAQGA
jgi:hypothetical protein